jgi:hypothetical protein
MPKFFGSIKNAARVHSFHPLRLEALEGRVLPAVIAGGAVDVAPSVPRDFETFVSSPISTAEGSNEKMAVAIVLSDSLSTVTQTAELAESISVASVGDVLNAQIWVKNIDGSLKGTVGGYLDLVYSESVLQAGNYTVSSLFSNMATYASTEISGRVSLVGGMASPNTKTLAVDRWALLGTFSFTVVGEGDGGIYASTPTFEGVENEAFNLARLGVGCLASDEIAFGSVTVVVSDGTGKLGEPTIKTGLHGVYVSGGTNRHLLTWGAVANASSYELAWSSDGSTWNTLETEELSATITGLTYGISESYKVRALGTGAYATSDWSGVKSFLVCPVDIDGDGDITGGDRALLYNYWLSSEEDDGFLVACDINGDGDITGGDRAFLSLNWLFSVEDDADDFVYPQAGASLLEHAVFHSLSDTNFEFT